MHLKDTCRMAVSCYKKSSHLSGW